MSALEAIILGLVQGLTEFLPVSSSGHLTIAKALFGVETNNLSFEVAVHAATVLSTLVAFRKEIFELLKGLFEFKMNSQTEYILKIAISMIPVFIVGVFFKDFVESLFGEGLIVVGVMLLVTASLLMTSEILGKKRADKEGREIGYKEAFIMGIAQAIAVLPGISRSGATISTGLICGVKKSDVARFSFLMVLVPILGEAFLELVGGELQMAESGISALSLGLGFITAFLSGLFACNLMIDLVKKAKLWGFAIYCGCAGVLSIIISLI